MKNPDKIQRYVEDAKEDFDYILRRPVVSMLDDKELRRKLVHIESCIVAAREELDRT